MSMLSAQIDELQKAAEYYDGSEVASIMRYAADTIWQLRDDLQRTNAVLMDVEHDESLVWDRVCKAEAETERLRERIVRCRDCKFYTPESMTREERGFGVYENVWEPGGCFNPERCSSTWDHVKEQMVSVGIDTDPDGFCAWGVTKEES